MRQNKWVVFLLLLQLHLKKEAKEGVPEEGDLRMLIYFHVGQDSKVTETRVWI